MTEDKEIIVVKLDKNAWLILNRVKLLIQQRDETKKDGEQKRKQVSHSDAIRELALNTRPSFRKQIEHMPILEVAQWKKGKIE
ncbi:MAG: hypothetical protein ACTSYD_02200 [Candidatus Heimdallarchaeaceae archaeon]